MWRLPVELNFAALKEAGDESAHLTDIEFGAGGSRGAECDTHELQARQRLKGTGGNDLQSVRAHCGVAFVFHDFQAVDHGAKGADEVVTHTADQKRREFDVVHGRGSL